MGRRVIINLILCLIFGTTLAFVFKDKESSIVTNLQYELASIQSNVPEEILKHTGYTVSYNKDWRIPNWVAYELTTEEVEGVFPRENKFIDDPAIYGEAETEDYSNSGYDRGHMAPAGDMKWSKIAMEESFYMTNICPQNHNLNGGDWKDLEEHVRKMASKYDHIYVCCGPIVESPLHTIGRYSFGRIVVPDAFFKVLLRQKKDSTWTAIGFKMLNKPGHNHLASYAMSVEELEKLTEFDFFYNLPDSIEEFVEKSYTLTDWDIEVPISNKPKHTTHKSHTKSQAEPIEMVSPVSETKDVQAQEAVSIEDATVQSTKTNMATSSSSGSTSSYKGHTIYVGPRGGRYYYNSKGKKVYIKH